MKKFLAILVATLCFMGVAFADEVDDILKGPTTSAEQVITPENIHPEMHPLGADKVQVTLRFTPTTDEIRFYYVCPNSRYDEGEARRTITACLEDFQAQYDYYSYKYMKKDSAHYFKDNNKLTMVRYEGHVKFFR